MQFFSLFSAFSSIFLVSTCFFGFAHEGDHLTEEFNTSNEYPFLQNVRQITFSDDGFTKCGEAYFSPDASTIIFQAVPKGKEHYQIYTLNLSEGIPHW